MKALKSLHDRLLKEHPLKFLLGVILTSLLIGAFLMNAFLLFVFLSSPPFTVGTICAICALLLNVHALARYWKYIQELDELPE